jgi:hypothetical protein
MPALGAECTARVSKQHADPVSPVNYLAPVSRLMQQNILTLLPTHPVTAVAPNPPTVSEQNYRNTTAAIWWMHNIDCSPMDQAFNMSLPRACVRLNGFVCAPLQIRANIASLANLSEKAWSSLENCRWR